MKERFKNNVVVFLILTRENNKEKEILLQLRNNTGFLDGKYDAAVSGHLEKGETISEAVIREAKEEIGIDININDLNFLAVSHEFKTEYIKFFFKAIKYKGVPQIRELNKCLDLKWFNINNLPDNLSPIIKDFLEKNKKNIVFYEEN